MSKNIVICCDGTGNEFGDAHTNVLRLVQVLDHDDADQILYYDPGVGTLPERGLFYKPVKTLSKWLSLGFGRGLVRNVEEAYTFLMDCWQPGDPVFLFGFSRGAYTVRVLAGLLWQVGLLRPGQHQLMPYAVRLYQAAPAGDEDDADHRSRYWRLCGQFRNTFCRHLPNQTTRRFPIRFVGVWDTVSSVGWVWNPKSFVYTAQNPGIAIVRHAVSLDERRAFFRQNLFRLVVPKRGKAGNQHGPQQDLRERWFPGVHSDIGGGYPEQRGALWKVAFDWLVDEAVAAGIRVNQAALDMIRSQPKPPTEPWAEPINKSLTWKWWLAEFFPKISYSQRWRMRVPKVGLFQPRRTGGAVLHESVLHKIRQDPRYRPKNLSKVMDQILALPRVDPGATLTVPS